MVSANQAALTVAAEWIGTSGVAEPMTTDRSGRDPDVLPELVDDPPPPVAEMRLMVEGADGVMIAAPEYAGGLAGSTKNALDWLVGSASIYHRPIAVLSAGTSGGVFAIEQLVRTLSWQGALVVATLGISAPRTKTNAGRPVRRSDRPSMRSNSGRVRWSTPPLGARGICWRSSAESSGRSASTSGGSAISDSQVTRAATAEPMRSTKLSA